MEVTYIIVKDGMQGKRVVVVVVVSSRAEV